MGTRYPNAWPHACRLRSQRARKAFLDRHPDVHQAGVERRWCTEELPACLLPVAGDRDDRALALQDALGDVQIHFAVVDDEDPHIAEPAAGRALGAVRDERAERIRRDVGRRGRRNQHGCPEFAPLARRDFEPDVAPHKICEALHDREPESGTTEASGGRDVGLRERRDDVSLDFRGDADARVPNAEVQLQSPVGQWERAGTCFHLPMTRKLHGVRQQLREDLIDARAIADRGIRNVGRNLQREADPARLAPVRSSCPRHRAPAA